MNIQYDETDRRSRKKEKTMGTIIENAMKAFEEKGFENTTMEEIAREADVAKATLYKYFPQKEAILAEYVKRTVAINKEAYYQQVFQLDSTEERIKYWLNNQRIWEKISKDLMEVYISYRMSHFVESMKNSHMRSGMEEIMMAIIESGKKSGEIKQGCDSQLIAMNMELLLVTHMVKTIINQQGDSVDDMERSIDMMLHGIKA